MRCAVKILATIAFAAIFATANAQTCPPMFVRLAKDSTVRIDCDGAALITDTAYKAILVKFKAHENALLAVLKKRTDAGAKLASLYDSTVNTLSSQNAYLRAQLDTTHARYETLLTYTQGANDRVATELKGAERTLREVRTQMVNLQFQISEQATAHRRERVKVFGLGAGAGALVATLVGLVVIFAK